MQDNALFALLKTTMEALEPTYGIPLVNGQPGVPVLQNFQPTQQGTPLAPSAFLHKVGDKRFGFVYREDIWDEVNSVEVHTEVQQYITTFQLSTLAIQNPSNISAPTASDLANIFAAIVQGSSFIATLEAQGIGILHVTNVRNPYFIDDKGRYEAAPSFDFEITHKQIVTSQVPVLESYEIDIFSI